MLLRRHLEVLDVGHPQLRVQAHGGLRADLRDIHDLHQAGRELVVQLLQIAQLPGLYDLLHLGLDGLADARDILELTPLVHFHYVLCEGLDVAGGLAVGLGLEALFLQL